MPESAEAPSTRAGPGRWTKVLWLDAGYIPGHSRCVRGVCFKRKRKPRQQRPAHQLAPEAKFVTESQRSGQQDDQGQRYHSQTSSSTPTSPSSTSPLVATTPSWMQLQHHTEPSSARQTSPLAATTPQWMQQQHLPRPFPPQQALHTRTNTITSTTYNTPLSLVKTPPLSPRASTTVCAGRGCCGPGP